MPSRAAIDVTTKAQWYVLRLTALQWTGIEREAGIRSSDIPFILTAGVIDGEQENRFSRIECRR